MKIFVQQISSDAKIPKRASNGAVGYDVYAYRILDKKTREPIGELPFVLEQCESVLIGIGVRFAIPWPIQCEVRPRSGLASKYDIELSNSPGTIDPDFRGEAGILLRNRGKNSFTLEKDMRIAQLVFSEVQIPVLEAVEKLPGTLRGTGGFGSTGLTVITEGTAEYEEQIRVQDIFYMQMAIAASMRSNCVRGCTKGADGKYLRDKKGRLINQTRRFGCVIVKDDNVVSHGFNAQAPGQPLCAEVGCLREQENITSGTKIERCRAIHAEWMAMDKMLKSGVGSSTQGATMYVTSEPCEICAKMITGLGLKDLVVLEDVYPQNGIEIAKAAGIDVRFVKKNDL
ncbi:MAG: dUTP diphosphatase [Candidatus Parcubacteria bacterium]|nr:dUTP diphosphatase [Candidatus Parcubacteria bacterium]